MSHWWAVAELGFSSIYCFAAVEFSPSQQKRFFLLQIPSFIATIGVGYATRDLSVYPLIALSATAALNFLMLFLAPADDIRSAAKHSVSAVTAKKRGFAFYEQVFFALYLVVSAVAVLGSPDQFVSTWGTDWTPVSAVTSVITRIYGTLILAIALSFYQVAFECTPAQQKKFAYFGIIWHIAGSVVGVLHRDATLGPAILIPIITVANAIAAFI